MMNVTDLPDRLHLQALLAALKPISDRHGHMRLAWVTALLLVALDEGKGVVHYAREANLHRAHMSRYLHYLGDKRNLHAAMIGRRDLGCLRSKLTLFARIVGRFF
jgi:hypothetical protein